VGFIFMHSVFHDLRREVSLPSNAAGRRRDSFEIVAHILGACHGNTKKTHLMYGCNMSFNQLNKYLDLLLDTGLLLVEYNSPSRQFRISDKGKDFLKAYQGLMSLME
jgi:predicted transcriptional regulator